MDIADSEHRRCIGEIGTHVEDRLGPSPVGGAQEQKRALPHLLVLLFQILLDDLAAELRLEPALVLFDRVTDLHENSAMNNVLQSPHTIARAAGNCPAAAGLLLPN